MHPMAGGHVFVRTLATVHTTPPLGRGPRGGCVAPLPLRGGRSHPSGQWSRTYCQPLSSCACAGLFVRKFHGVSNVSHRPTPSFRPVAVPSPRPHRRHHWTLHVSLVALGPLLEAAYHDHWPLGHGVHGVSPGPGPRARGHTWVQATHAAQAAGAARSLARSLTMPHVPLSVSLSG